MKKIKQLTCREERSFGGIKERQEVKRQRKGVIRRELGELRRNFGKNRKLFLK